MKNSQNSKNYTDFLKETKTFKKIYSCFESMERDKNFIEKVRKIREKNKIPENGFSYPLRKEDFDKTYSKIFSRLSMNAEFDYSNEVDDIAKRYGIQIFGNVLDYFIFYGSIEPFVEFGDVNVAQLFEIEDVFYSDKENNITPLTTGFGGLDIFRDALPIAILINPYMSQRDIIDFIKVMYTEWIEPMQKEYKAKDTPVGSARKKSDFVKKRNLFIYKNRDKPAKEVMSLVRKKFGRSLDYTYIQKIIRDEKNKRS